MKKKMTLILAVLISTAVIGAAPGFAASNIELEERIEALEKGGSGSALGNLPLWDRFTLSGAIELDYAWADDKDVADKGVSSSTSELDITTIELGLEGQLHDYVTANILLKGENLASDDDKVFWDEVFFTFAKEGLPIYFVGGKRAQPFGLFESLFINDPITQDLYEIADTGATIGFTHEDLMNLDLSFTIYKGDTLMERVNEAEYGWERNTSAGYGGSDSVNSYILSSAISPVEGMTLALYFNSEEGDSDRNTTMGGSFHFEIARFILDFEYIGALDREKHVSDDREYKESAWTASVGFQVMDPLVVAVRYEDFDPGRDADGCLDYRYSVGADYTLWENNGFACNLMGEYRHSEYDASAGAANDEENDELFFRVALGF